jgi:hypothetical protein
VFVSLYHDSLEVALKPFLLFFRFEVDRKASTLEVFYSWLLLGLGHGISGNNQGAQIPGIQIRFIGNKSLDWKMFASYSPENCAIFLIIDAA